MKIEKMKLGLRCLLLLALPLCTVATPDAQLRGVVVGQGCDRCGCLKKLCSDIILWAKQPDGVCDKYEGHCKDCCALLLNGQAKTALVCAGNKPRTVGSVNLEHDPKASFVPGGARGAGIPLRSLPDSSLL